MAVATAPPRVSPAGQTRAPPARPLDKGPDRDLPDRDLDAAPPGRVKGRLERWAGAVVGAMRDVGRSMLEFAVAVGHWAIDNIAARRDASNTLAKLRAKAARRQPGTETTQPAGLGPRRQYGPEFDRASGQSGRGPRIPRSAAAPAGTTLRP
jgi:hypothetical protein